MVCCGKKLKTGVVKSQRDIVRAVINEKNSKKSTPFRPPEQVTRSNRVPVGSKVRDCSVCGTKTIVTYCPVCGNILL
jgi:CRISPR/Cas system-associated protein Cas10 (large subunit of type III CRISPR-Cas system)